MNKRIERALKTASSLVFAAALTTAGLQAQSTAGPARLAIRSGLVEVQRGNVWLPLAGGDLVNAGERVRTASGSAANLGVQ